MVTNEVLLLAKLNALSALMELSLGETFGWRKQELQTQKAAILDRIRFNSVSSHNDDNALTIQSETLRVVEEMLTNVEKKCLPDED